MKESKERLQTELESLVVAARDKNKRIDSVDVYVVGSEFFFGDTKSQDLLSSDIDGLLSVFIGSVGILFSPPPVHT